MSSPNSNNNNKNADILDELGLNPNTTQHTYQNINHFIKVLTHETGLFTADKHASSSRSQYFIFHEVTESIFNRDFIDPIDSIVTFESYFPRRGIMLVKIVTRGHAHASRSIGLELSIQVWRMKEELNHILLPFGSAHVISPNRIKRADESFVSRWAYKERRSSIEWPNLCMEVGYSDSPRKLEGDARWWIGESRGEVRSVLTVELNKGRREMRVSQWRGFENGARLVYRVVIGQKDGTMVLDEEKDLVIPFEDLFLRPANKDEGERDVVYEVEELKSLAERVWEVEFEEFETFDGDGDDDP